MDLEFTTFVRRPFVVEAVEITEDNIAEIAKLVGHLRKKPDGTHFIRVNNFRVPNLDRVYPGFWMTKMNDNVRCYSRRIFMQQFMEKTDDIQPCLDILSEEGDEGFVPQEVGAFGRPIEATNG